jgi:hypothetical protein
LDHMTDRHHHMRFLHMTNRRHHMRLPWVCLSWISHDRPPPSYTYMYVQVLFSANVCQSLKIVLFSLCSLFVVKS